MSLGKKCEEETSYILLAVSGDRDVRLEHHFSKSGRSPICRTATSIDFFFLIDVTAVKPTCPGFGVTENISILYVISFCACRKSSARIKRRVQKMARWHVINPLQRE